MRQRHSGRCAKREEMKITAYKVSLTSWQTDEDGIPDDSTRKLHTRSFTNEQPLEARRAAIQYYEELHADILAANDTIEGTAHNLAYSLQVLLHTTDRQKLCVAYTTNLTLKDGFPLKELLVALDSEVTIYLLNDYSMDVGYFTVKLMDDNKLYNVLYDTVAEFLQHNPEEILNH